MTPTLCTFRVGHHQRYPPWSVHPLPYPLLFWQGRESRATATRASAASQNLVGALVARVLAIAVEW